MVRDTAKDKCTAASKGSSNLQSEEYWQSFKFKKRHGISPCPTLWWASCTIQIVLLYFEFKPVNFQLAFEFCFSAWHILLWHQIRRVRHLQVLLLLSSRPILCWWLKKAFGFCWTMTGMELWSTLHNTSTHACYCCCVYIEMPQNCHEMSYIL